MTPTRTYLPSINTLACSNAEIQSLYLKILTSPASGFPERVHKIYKKLLKLSYDKKKI